MDIDDKYLNMSDNQIDKLLLGVNLESKDINPTENKIQFCINCKSDDLIMDNIKGHIVCSSCGVINQEYLDGKPEFSNDGDGNNSRYGCPSNFFLPQSSLSTKIKCKGYNKLSIIQKQGQMPYKEKSLMEVLERIQQKCRKYKLTQTIIDTAKILYNKVSETVHTKGKRKGKNIIMRCINRRSMIAACVFYACKLQRETRSPKEIADIYDLEIKNVNRGCRNFSDIIDSSTIFHEIKSSHAVDFIERFGKKLNINKQYIMIAKDVAINIHKLNFASTHEPPSVAAGCIVMIATYYNLNISKKDISDIFNISDVTISKTYRKILPYQKILFSNFITNMISERMSNLKTTSTINNSNLIINNDTESDVNTETIEDDDEEEDEEYKPIKNTNTLVQL
jgi:transcription initiation factor TFIIIB Brf1 subunit/transcription initiation factor TFIIB